MHLAGVLVQVLRSVDEIDQECELVADVKQGMAAGRQRRIVKQSFGRISSQVAFLSAIGYAFRYQN